MSVECSTNSFLSSLRITSAPVSIRLGDQLGHADKIIRCSQESRVDAICFPPLAGDFRVACTTNGSGLQRPLVWDPSSGERINLCVDDLEGEITPVDRSEWKTAITVAGLSGCRSVLSLQYCRDDPV